MTSTASIAGATGAPVPRDDVRRAWRDLREPIVGGVAGGLAAHLAVPVIFVRVAFVVATVMGGLGIMAYAALWVLLPAGPPTSPLAPGLEAAARDGRRPGRVRRLSDLGPVIILGALAVGALFAIGALFGASGWLWPLAIAVVGIALLWRQVDEAERERWLDATGRVDPVRVLVGSGGWAAWARIAAGVVLILVALLVFTARDGSLSVARDVTVSVLLACGGLVIVVGPWIWRLMAELSTERAERVRTQERADVAAHLHDSVLQTLALIQKNPSDAARLARAQERDLRAWLYAGESMDETTVASALRAMAAEIEDGYAVKVDLVVVGDAALADRLRPIVLASREATTNAAKHARVTRIDVYAEIAADAIDVFVRDRGRGFHPANTPEDRLGVRRSIIDRMERHGGRAEIRSAPGEGTEVRLHLDRKDDEGEQ